MSLTRKNKKEKVREPRTKITWKEVKRQKVLLFWAAIMVAYGVKGGKKVVQTISYLPHFLSWIIVTGILHDMLSGTGIVNEFLVNMHIIDQPINFFAHPGYFWPIVAFANVWNLCT